MGVCRSVDTFPQLVTVLKVSTFSALINLNEILNSGIVEIGRFY